MKYTESNFYSKWADIFKIRGDEGITGEVLKDFMTDIMDSCVFKSSGGGSTGSGIKPPYPTTIIADDLDVNNVVSIEHGLGTLIPQVYLYGDDNEALSTLEYSFAATDENTVEITLEDELTEGDELKVLVVYLASDAERNYDYIDSVLFINFIEAVFEGAQYYRQPVGWRSYTTLQDGTEEDHLDTDHNFSDASIWYGMQVTNYDTGTDYYLVLENKTRYVRAGDNYKVTMNFDTAFNFYINICGQDHYVTGNVFEATITSPNTGKFFIKTLSTIDNTFLLKDLKIEKL